jgi:hypothetical protein
MIRTLLIIAAVSFVLAVGCLAGALAVAGGPFSIDERLRFHPGVFSVDCGPAVSVVTHRA